MDLSTDIEAMYADFGVSASHTPNAGGQVTTALAILDEPGQEVIGGEIIATDYSLRFPTASFPAVKRLDAFTINGVTFTAREDAQPLQDGLEQIVPLAKG